MADHKERPILFSGAMVRAILAGKTQTRRVVKCKSYKRTSGTLEYNWDIKTGKHLWMLDDNWKQCPYGQPGDRLWVRETIELQTLPGNDFPSPVYAADGSHVMDDGKKASNHQFMRRRVHPSIHMPRWACRIVLEIVSVRVERLQDISEEDAKAEGILRAGDGYRGAEGRPWFANPVAAYADLWESINGPGSWEANPWVWVIEFKRVNDGH